MQHWFTLGMIIVVPVVVNLLISPTFRREVRDLVNKSIAFANAQRGSLRIRRHHPTEAEDMARKLAERPELMEEIKMRLSEPVVEDMPKKSLLSAEELEKKRPELVRRHSEIVNKEKSEWAAAAKAGGCPEESLDSIKEG